MEQIRAHVSQPGRGQPAGLAREIVARHLDELIVPYACGEARALARHRCWQGTGASEARALPGAHRAADGGVIIASLNLENPDRALRLALPRGWPVASSALLPARL